MADDKKPPVHYRAGAQPIEAVGIPGTLLRESTVAAALGTSLSTLRRMVKLGQFPPPVPNLRRPKRWLSDDYMAWLLRDGDRRP